MRITRSSVGDLYDLVLSAIRECPDRGEVLPHTQQPECGCAELTRCHAGRGTEPGRVTTTDCVVCRCAMLGIGDDSAKKSARETGISGLADSR